MAKITPIFTLRDSMKLKAQAEALRELHLERKELRAKIRRWKGKVARYGGEINEETLARFEAKLAALS